MPTDPVPVILGWLMHGLNFEAALRQPQLPFKLRHLKVGVRLAAALFCCDSALAGRLAARGVLSLLMDLAEREHMAASVRLLIVTALSAAVRWQTGLQVTRRPLADRAAGNTPSAGRRDCR